jgi:hypothetical protein
MDHLSCSRGFCGGFFILSRILGLDSLDAVASPTRPHAASENDGDELDESDGEMIRRLAVSAVAASVTRDRLQPALVQALALVLRGRDDSIGTKRN